MALSKLGKLLALELRYFGALLRSPAQARHFWSALYHSAMVTDRSLAAATAHALPTRAAEELLPGLLEAPYTLLDFRQEYGGVSHLEARILAASIRLLEPRVLFEIGTFNGATTRQLAVNAPEGAVVHTIDLPVDHPLRGDRSTVDVAPERVGEAYRGTPEEAKIRQLYGNTLDFDFSPYRRGVDWIFVDAAHTYEAVRSDSENALRMIRPGGVIFWHDVSRRFAGNCRALSEVAARWPVHHLAGTSLAFLLAAEGDEPPR